jgi:hypothetical protein
MILLALLSCFDKPVADEAPTTHSFTFINSCEETVWVGSFGQNGTSAINGGGWKMESKAVLSFDVPVSNSGRVWARTGCSFDENGLCPEEGVDCCATGGCLVDDKNFGLACTQTGKPPASLVEWTLDAPSGNGPIDTYDSSMVDGWSTPTRMFPTADFNPEPDPGMDPNFWCNESGCKADKKLACPEGYAVPGSPDSCYSPCQVATNAAKDETKYCCVCSMKEPITCPDEACAGGYGCTPYHDPAYPADMVCNPWSDDPARAWDQKAQDYIKTVHDACPNVYAWQFDDSNATYHCRKTDGLVGYTIEFCPENDVDG